MRKEISVQEGEIAIAQRGVSTRCAIAAAIMTQVPAARNIKVDRDTISWRDVDRQERLVFRTPPSAVTFIENWDLGNPVEPFGFYLTDSQLIERRAPRTVSTRTRIKRVNKPVKRPGSRMTRAVSGGECAEGDL